MSRRDAARVARAGALLALLVSSVAASAQRPAPSDAREFASGFVPLDARAIAPGLDRPVSLSLTAPLRELLARIVGQADLSMAFDDSLPGLDARTTIHVVMVPARAAVVAALSRSPLRALVSATGQIVLVRRDPRAERSSNVDGMLRDAQLGTPVAGARIELAGTRYAAYSRADGGFSLGRVPHGQYVLRVLRIGYEPVARRALRIPDDLIDGALDLPMNRASLALSEIIVTPGYFGLLQPSLAAPQALSREQLETIPQIGEDIYRAVSRLPGVSADDFSAKFSVRGGSGDELYVSLDGLELVEPFHLKDVGGSFSIIDIQALGTASLTTGGFSAEYGDRLTGVFTLATADPRTDRVRTSLGVSVMNARATSQGGFAGGKGGWLVSARPGYLDLALKLTSVRDSIKPRYYDLFAKAQYDLGRGGRVALHLLRASDSFRYVQDDEPNIASDYTSNYAWLTWDDQFGSRLRMKSVISVGALDWRRDGEHAETGRSATRIVDRRSLERIGVRQDWTLDASPRVMFKWGFDAKRESAAYDYFSAVPDRSVTDSTAMDTTAALASPRTNRFAAYVAPRVRLLPSLTLELGARFDHNSHLGESMVSPRVNLSWEPRDGTTLRAAWGHYSQTQPLFTLQAQDGVSAFARAERAEQRVLGVEQLLPFGITGRVEAYERRTRDARPVFINAGGDLWLFPELSWDRVLVDRTQSRDRGIELQASRRGAGRTDWSLSYALASSTDVVGGQRIPRSLDERHAVHGDWSVRPASNAWRLSVGAVWHSGWPYTPTNFVVDTLVDTPSQLSLRAEQKLGALNSLRLRSYRRIDVRWTRYFDTSRGRMSVFGEVFNLLDFENARGIWKTIHVRGRRISVESGEITQWPRLPLAGFTWEF